MYLSVFIGYMIKNTQNTNVFGNVILFLHIGWFASVLAFFVCKSLKRHVLSNIVEIAEKNP